MNGIFEEKETLKCRTTGRIFEVYKRTDHMVILRALDGLTQVFTGKKSLFGFFEKNLNDSLRTSEKAYEPNALNP